MEENKKLNEIEIDELIKSVYSKIANWHNDDTTSSGLKFTVLEIIQECTNNTLRQIGLNEITTDIKLDEETKKEALQKKQESEEG
jgi:hypothetical protein